MKRITFLLACLLSTGAWAQVNCQTIGGMTSCYNGSAGSPPGGWPFYYPPTFMLPPLVMPVQPNRPFMPSRQFMPIGVSLPARPFMPVQPFMPVPYAQAQACYHTAFGSYLCM